MSITSYDHIIDGARLCVGRAQLVEVGQNTFLSIALDEQENNNK